MWGDIAIAFLIAFISAFMTTPYTIRIAKKLGAVDTPNDERRINKITMPRLGGLAIIIGFIVSSVFLIVAMSLETDFSILKEHNFRKICGFLAGGIIIGTVCFLDDVKGMPAIAKLFAQIIAAGIAVYAGIVIDHIDIPFIDDNYEFSKIFYIILTMGWIIGITNAMNLIDGLDGLAAGISFISALSLLIIFSLNGSPIISIVFITALAGSLAGFLPYNFNPAKTFMGDTGSNFLGYCLSIISILGIAKTYTAIVIVAPLLVLALPLFDTLSSIFRRIAKYKSLKAIFKPDANHIHHKMLKKGFTQKQAVLIMYGISATLGMFVIIWMESGTLKAVSFLSIVLFMTIIGYKEYFKQRLLDSDSDSQNIEGQIDIEDELDEENKKKSKQHIRQEKVVNIRDKMKKAN